MSKITRYKEIEAFLFKQLPMYQRVGPKAFKKDLKNIKVLSKYLGHPHKFFKSIHIAGTNGKGSTSFFIASLLSELGFKVGLYTSPHYKDYRERIKVNGQMIEKAYVKKFINGLIDDDIFNQDLRPSFFEISVAMAFSYFKEKKVDFAVIETGLGGRLDSTNIINPELSIITNIGLDHVQFLGNTLPLIAKEKAGIIKKNTPVIIGRKQKETTAVFKSKAVKMKSSISWASITKIKGDFQWEKLFNTFPNYQKENITTACYAVSKMNFSLSQKILQKAFKSGLTKWRYVGRYTIVNKKPKTIYDSAHNEAGIKVLMDQIKEKERYNQIHIVLAVVNDKDPSQLFPFLPVVAQYYFSQAKIPRAMPRQKLQTIAEEYGIYGSTYTSIKRALYYAKKKADQGDLILVTGSIFTVAEVI